MQKQVNVKVQMLASIFIPSGAYAFCRINKQNKGTILYVTTGILSILGFFTSTMNYQTPYYWDGVLGQISRYTSDSTTHGLLILFTLSSSLISIIVPMLYIRKWSIDWNNKLES